MQLADDILTGPGKMISMDGVEQRYANNTEYAPPPATALVESLRGVGYSLATAVADTIDNSISAGAGAVWLDFHWNGASSWISILDDGSGMSEEDLSKSMRLGGLSPLQDRRPEDLGRFGLGMKTAAFSHSRRLTVASKKDSQTAIRRWDLDFMSQEQEDWKLLLIPEPGSEGHLQPLDRLASGTMVLWEVMDRLVGSADADDPGAQDLFLMTIDRVARHIAMVFHRFIEGTAPKLRIFINGNEDRHRVLPWDPFMSTHPATIRKPLERLQGPFGGIELQGFILPHKDRLKEKEFDEAGGPEGWISQQGFYIYRNKRLIVAGGWLGLGGNQGWTKEEAYRLARIRLDISNTADALWKIDIKKSVAKPPQQMRQRLREIAEDVRLTARHVFAHRGKYGRAKPSPELQHVWASVERREGVTYRVNRKHPAVTALYNAAPELASEIDAMLRLIEETVPVQRIWLDSADRGGINEGNFTAEPPEEVIKVLNGLYRHLRIRTQMTPDAAKALLMKTEPFHLYKDLVEGLSDSE